MVMKNIILVVAALLGLVALVHTKECMVTVDVEPRGPSWQDGGKRHQTYDIIVTNTGDCVVSTLFVDLKLPASASIVQSWNINVGTGEILNFGGILNPGNSLDPHSGFILQGNGNPSVSVKSVECNDCKPATTTGGGATTGATMSTTGAHGGCSGTITIAPRQGQQGWIENGQLHRVFDLTLTNNGPCVITGAFANITLPHGATIQQAWNLLMPSNEIINFGSLQMGQSFSAAGFIMVGNGSPTASAGRVSCSMSCPGSGTTGGATTAGATTGAATTGTTGQGTTSSSTTGGERRCRVRVRSEKRPANAGGSWKVNGVSHQIYDLTITNTGTLPVATLSVSIVPSGASTEVSESWNLDRVGTTNVYRVDHFDLLASAGGVFTGAGFVLAGNGAVSVALDHVDCE